MENRLCSDGRTQKISEGKNHIGSIFEGRTKRPSAVEQGCWSYPRSALLNGKLMEERGDTIQGSCEGDNNENSMMYSTF